MGTSHFKPVSDGFVELADQTGGALNLVGEMSLYQEVRSSVIFRSSSEWSDSDRELLNPKFD